MAAAGRGAPACFALAIALGGLHPEPARAWEVRATVAPAEPAQIIDSPFFETQDAAMSPALDASGMHMVGRRLLRLAPDGAIVSVGGSDLWRAGLQDFVHLLTSPTADIIAWNDRGETAALSPEGEVRWIHTEFSALSGARWVDADGGILFGMLDVVETAGSPRVQFLLVRLGPDGSVDHRTAVPIDTEVFTSGGRVHLFPVPASSDLILAGQVSGSPSAATHLAVTRLSRQGARRWLWIGPHGRIDAAPPQPTLALEPDAGVRFAAPVEDGSGAWIYRRLDAQGRIDSTNTVALGADLVSQRVYLRAQGSVYAYQFPGDDAGAGRLLTLAGDGEVVSERALNLTCRSLCLGRVAPNGDLVMTGIATTGFRMERHAATGATRFVRQIGAQSPGIYFASDLGANADGTQALVLLQRLVDAPQAKVDGAPLRLRALDQIEAIDLDGDIAFRTDLPSQPVNAADPPAFALDPGGRITLVVPLADASASDLAEIDADGSLGLRTRIQPAPGWGRPQGLAHCGDDLCVGYGPGIRVHADAGHGGLRRQHGLGDAQLSALHVYPDAAVLLEAHRVHPEISDLRQPAHVLLDAAGAERVLAPGLARMHVMRFDRLRGALLVGDDEQGWLDGAGAFSPVTRASLETPPALAPAAPGHSSAMRRVLDLPNGDTVQLALHRQSLSVWSRSLRLELTLARFAADGQMRWLQRWHEGGRIGQLTALDVALSANARDKILLSRVRSASNSVLMTALNAVDGRVITQRELPCPGVACRAQDFSVDAEGAARGVSYGGGLQAAAHGVVGAEGLFDAPARSIDASIDGAWYAPGATGQGVSLRYDAATGRLVMPWFTFARTVGHAPAGLRWFLGNGVVDANAGTVSIPLFESSAGRFDAAPAATSRIVGEAVLRYASCDRVELAWQLHPTYAVDDDGFGGGQGVLTLQRLLPARTPCAGSGAAPAVHYDSSTSGIWYEPATSGQGFDLFRTSDTATGPGILAGAWFTHDPAGSHQPAARSPHWFALAGGSVDGDGSIRADIIQTLGGHLGGTPTRNARVVGDIRFRSESCSRLQASYRFDDREIAGEFRGHSGEMQLLRLSDGCVASTD